MLYVKVDENGEALDVAKSYTRLKAEHLAEGKIIPSESHHKRFFRELGYEQVPATPETEPDRNLMVGCRLKCDIPVKGDDGIFQRRWIYEKVSDEELSKDGYKSELALIGKEKRQRYLKEYCDSISPLRWNSWTPEEQQEVTEWYQFLLNMPEMEGWPLIPLPDLPTPLKR